MDTAERLLKLLGLLEGRIDWTADDLARRLEVTTRTVRRDITRLRDLGYPVEAVAGPGGGYRLGAGGKLPPLLLDDEEALAVALGLRVAAVTAVGGLEDASLSALSKLEHVLPPRLRTQLEDISEATVSTVSTSASSADHGLLAMAASAARSRQRMRFGYIDNEGRALRRHVEPLRLVHTGRRWYLVAFDLDRDDWRTFRLDRVSQSQGDRECARPGVPRPTRRAGQPRSRHRRLHPSGSVRLWSPRSERRTPFQATVGALEELGPEETRLVIGADDLNWLARYLISFPWDFVVEEPTELTKELRKIGRSLAATHS